MSDLEARWAEVERSILRVENAHVKYLDRDAPREAIDAYADVIDEQRAAVRNLALAVLEEAWLAGTGVRSMRYSDLKARIEALGQ